ncbi:hypothetical protein WA026_023662 [Henosepilachna vigintioctopunctata]|uniref:Uncharacterized protein n=1 Tax=Henosepilachna vigintioctopunctata TaxID=420089 RepID=A0AAW1V5R9_9CUCU
MGSSQSPSSHRGQEAFQRKVSISGGSLSHLNNSSRSLQGRVENILTTKGEVKAFYVKLTSNTVEYTETTKSLRVNAHSPSMIQSFLQEKLLACFPDLHSEADNVVGELALIFG